MNVLSFNVARSSVLRRKDRRRRSMHVEALKVSENGDAAGVKPWSVTSRKPKRLNVAVCRVGGEFGQSGHL